MTKQPYSYIGLYEITDRSCEVSESALDECNKTQFIELVKGQFFGIKNNEIALVMWRGDKGEELLYQARKLEQLKSDMSLSGKIIISGAEGESESLELVDGQLLKYSLVINKMANKNAKQTSVKYTLKPVKRGLLPGYRMNYPAND